MAPRPRRRVDERGAASVIIMGFVVFLVMTIAMVVDASSAYLQRQGLDGLADGAALRGADLGATGQDVYVGGVPAGQLAVTPQQARDAVGAYLRDVGAEQRYPGLTYDVAVDPAAGRIEVRLRAPLDLPLAVPGSPGRASIGATGSAVSGVDP